MVHPPTDMQEYPKLIQDNQDDKGQYAAQQELFECHERKLAITGAVLGMTQCHR